MQQKSLLILTGLTVVALAVAGLSTRDGKSSDEGDVGEVLVEGLVDRVNDVAEIFVENADGSVTLKKTGDTWTLVERGGYPVDFERVRESVVGLARMEIEEPKTAIAANHSKLGIADPESGDPVATRVRLLDASGEVLAALILGSSRPRGGDPAVFVRHDGEDQVYLCAGRFEFDTVPTDWIDSEIVSLETDRIATVDILHQDGEVLQLARASETDTSFDVLDVPEGRELLSPTIANGVSSVLSRLSLDEVRPAHEVDFNDDPIATSYFRCYDGLTVEVKLVNFEDGVWARVDTFYEEREVVGPVPDEDPEGEEGEVDPDALYRGKADPDAIRAEVAELDQRLNPWAFALPEYKLKILARRMEDLLKEEAVEVVEEAPVLDPLAPGDDSGGGAMSLEELMRDAGPVLKDAEPEPPEDDGDGHEGHDHGAGPVLKDAEPEAPEDGNDETLDSSSDPADEVDDPGRS
jgi:hypothetical protein